MNTPYLDRLIEELENHIESVEAASYAGILETKRELAEFKAIKQALILPVVVKPLYASFKVGDKVLKSGIFDAQIIEELKPNVWKIKYPDGYEMLARTEDLYLATESV